LVSDALLQNTAVIPLRALAAQASDVQLHIGESTLPAVVVDFRLALRAPSVAQLRLENDDSLHVRK
jgi:hypothetical protein